MVEPGHVLAGKFQVERVLGQGGMGVVVAAHHLQLGQLVALKFLLPEAMRNPDTTERFLREARASVRLKSEHVGRVIDVGTLDTGSPYMVMEYLEGQDLEQFRRDHGRLPLVQAIDFVLQACEAVAEAHSLGIIHRDLKPANLFLTVRPDGAALVKVLDFGISKATQDNQDFSLTRTATVMGSPGYMSPEQLRSARDVDLRTDVWALGVILYELVTGRAPFKAETITELTLKVAMDPTPPMDVPGVGGFEEVVKRCLEKEPANRFGSVAELAAALAPFGGPGAVVMAQRIARVQGGQTTNVRASSAMSLGTAPTTLSAISVDRTRPGGGRRLGLWLGLGGVVVATVVVTAIVVGGGGKSGGGAEPGTAAGTDIGSGSGTATPDPDGSGSALVGSGSGSGTATEAAVDAGVAAVPIDAAVDAASRGSAVAGSGTGRGSHRGSGRGSRRGSGRGSHRGSGSAGTGTAAGTGAGTGSQDFSNSRF